MLHSRHLRLYEQYFTALLELYERHCPGFCAILALVSVEQDSYRLLKSSIGIAYHSELWCVAISPIVHPQRRDVGDPKLTEIIIIPAAVWDSGVHPLLASMLAPCVPQICLETNLSFLRYLHSGGHSGETRRALKPLLKSSHFTRLKMRPWLARFRKRQLRHLRGHYLLSKGRLHSAWWGDHRLRPNGGIKDRESIRVPLRFFSYQLEYASNYDLWYTYRYALQLLPSLLANTPPDSQLASTATDCIFNSFCTAYPRETRKARKSIEQYLFRCRPIRAMPLGGRIVVNSRNTMDVD